MRKLVFFLFVWQFSTLVNANDQQCSSLRNTIFSEEKITLESVLPSLENEVEKGSLCAKNIIGRMYSEGRLVETDIERGYAIFYELAQQGYVPSQFNLAYLMAQKNDVTPEAVLNYLQGFISTYIADSKYGHLVPRATSLGRDYLAAMERAGKEVSDLRACFEGVVRQANTTAAQNLVQKTRQRRETEDAIMGILAIGFAVAETSSRLGSAAGGVSSGKQLVPAPAWMGYRGIIGPRSGYTAPAWGSYPGIIGPNLLYLLR